MSTLSENRKARFEYEILDSVEAGLVLSGQETKSVKNGGMNLTGSFVTFHGATPLLTNATIAPYKQAGPLPEYDPGVSRRLLFHKKEIYRLRAKVQEEGLTLVPLSVYTKGRLIKIKVALARGRKRFDKRVAIKKREFKREARSYTRM